MAFRRICKICDFIGLDIDFFTFNKNKCNTCIAIDLEDKEANKIINAERRKERAKIWRLDNQDKIKEYVNNYSKKITKEKRKEYRNNRDKEKLREYYRNYMRNRRISDPLFKLSTNIRNLISISISKQGYSKKSKTFQILGISCIDFKIYIENLFQDGMSWENYGDWHLDHITPVSSATTEESLLSLNYYKNFQPLWAIDNRTKGNRL